MFHSAPGAYFVWNEIFLFVSAVRDCSCPGAGYLSEKIVWGIWSKTVRLWDPGFCLKPSISVYVRDRWRFDTVRLREPVLVIYGPGAFSFEGETRR